LRQVRAGTKVFASAFKYDNSCRVIFRQFITSLDQFLEYAR
jgi:hypothetical protein